MQRFLEACAEYVLEKFSSEFTNTTVVVPNRRSGLFFSAYLRKRIDHPVIGPEIVPISEWMVSFSGLHNGDRLSLISDLFEIFRKETGTNESFDDFYFWGEVLLSDFDDLDKYLVNAADLFKNLLSLKETELRFDYLSEEQKEAILQFWGSLRTWDRNDHEKEFIFFWEKFRGIYTGFKDKLAGKGQGYPGMIMRDGLTNLESRATGFNRKNYVITGMNALNACEKRVFTLLKDSGTGIFLWDFDDYYTNDRINNAGQFIRENLEAFPPPEDFILQTDNFQLSKTIELVAFPSLTGQSQILPSLLKNQGIGNPENFDHTAIVLADESLLFHVLGAIPEEAGAVNVTMGYPVRNSPVVSLLNLITLLIRNTPSGESFKGLYHKPVTDILSHQLLHGIESEKAKKVLEEIRLQNMIYLPAAMLYFSDLHNAIFTIPAGTEDYPDYFLTILRILYRETTNRSNNRILKETIYATYLAIEKLLTIVNGNLKEHPAELTPSVFFRLMMQYLNQVSVPFEGEPLSGTQVMGILETRCLDFDNLIIIGLNEEVWPKGETAPSMIPYNLRKGFGLPGIDEQDAMYAYYFYRLLQRAEKITITWNTVREALTGGELSRLGFQLELLSPHQIIRKNFDFPLLKNSYSPVSMASSPSVAGRLINENRQGKALSPSAILTYLHCSLKFYFSYVVGLKEEDEVKEEIDRVIFGNIFHKAMEILYQPFLEKEVQVNDLDRLLSSEEKKEYAVMQAIAGEFYKFFKGDATRLPLEGKAMLIKSTLKAYIRNLLEFDRKYSPFVIHALEKTCETTVTAEIDHMERNIRIGGKLDRVDETCGILRVVDYKTGSMKKENLRFTSYTQLFDSSKKEIRKESIQSLIYAWIVHKNKRMGKPVQAAVYSILNLKNKQFPPEVSMSGIPVSMPESADAMEIFLQGILKEIFSKETVFSQTEFTERCSYCPYSVICRRG